MKVVKRFGKFAYIDKIICFICSAVMDFCQGDKVKCTTMSETFVENVEGILYTKAHIHQSNIIGDIIGYSHSFCNFRVRENKKKISVVTHNFFHFDFFFFLTGIRAGLWRTKDTSIGGKNPTDINFAHIGNQIVFIDSIKYFQQKLGTLRNAMTDDEKLTIKKECKNLFQEMKAYLKNLTFAQKKTKNGFLIIFLQEKEQFPMK